MNFENLRYHLDIAGTCFIPFVLASVPFGLGVDYRGWSGAVILASLQIGLLFGIVWLLKKKASLGLPATAGALFLFYDHQPGTGWQFGWQGRCCFCIFSVLRGSQAKNCYTAGHIETRLNEAFPRPYRFFDVDWGWGTILGALIFGLEPCWSDHMADRRSGQTRSPGLGLLDIFRWAGVQLCAPEDWQYPRACHPARCTPGDHHSDYGFRFFLNALNFFFWRYYALSSRITLHPRK